MLVTDTTHSAARSPALVAVARKRIAGVGSATSDTMFTGSSFLVVKPLVARSMAPGRRWNVGRGRLAASKPHRGLLDLDDALRSAAALQ
jgi:hypothetical protein